MVRTPSNLPLHTMHVTEGRNHLGSLVGSHASELGIELQLLPWNNFCHHVNCILTCEDLLQLESFQFYSIMNLMISDFNMLCLGVIGSILVQVYCTLTITIYHILILFQTQFLGKSLHPQYPFANFSGSYIFSFSCG